MGGIWSSISETKSTYSTYRWVVTAFTVLLGSILGTGVLLAAGRTRTAQAQTSAYILHTTVDDFTNCRAPVGPSTSLLNDTSVANTGGGEVRLAAALEDYFDGTSVDSTKWISTRIDIFSPWPSVSGGILTLDNNSLRSIRGFSQNLRIFETRAVFQANPPTTMGAHDIGWGRANSPGGGTPSNESHRLFISKISPSNSIYANGRDGGGTIVERNLTSVLTPSQYYTYRINWDTGTPNTLYYVDDVERYSTTLAATPETWVWLYALRTDGTTRQAGIDWVRVNSYPLTGTYTSCPLRINDIDSWTSLDGTVVSDTTTTQVAFQTRTSSDGTTWNGWEDVASNGTLSATAQTYLQYRAFLTTTDFTQSPEIQDVTINYSFNPLNLFVDDSWSGTTTGVDPDGSGPATSFGYDSFATIGGALAAMDPNATVTVSAGTYNESPRLSANITLVGSGGPIIDPPSGQALEVNGATADIRGFNLQDASEGISLTNATVTFLGNTVFSVTNPIRQVGGSLTAYANNISNFTTGINSSGGTINARHNWWGAVTPSGVNNTDAETYRLGAAVSSWGQGTLGGASISGGTGTGVIVSHGRGLTAAPFGIVSDPDGSASNACSDYYDFFVAPGGSGNWSVSIPVDANTNCDTTFTNTKLFGFATTGGAPDTSCSPNPSCWNALGSVTAVSGSPRTLNVTLSTTDLGGTPLVSGNQDGNDPTAIVLSGTNLTSRFNQSNILLIAGTVVLSLLAAFGFILLSRRVLDNGNLRR